MFHIVSNLEESIFSNLKHEKKRLQSYCIYLPKSNIYANLKPGEN